MSKTLSCLEKNLWLYVGENHMYKEFQLGIRSTTIKRQRKEKRQKRDRVRKHLETQKLN